MGAPDRGPGLIACTVIFGFGAVSVVVLRFWFRIYRHRLDASDWLIGAALVRIAAPTSAVPYSWVQILIAAYQVCSIAQDVFNLIRKSFRDLPNPLVNVVVTAVVDYGYGKHADTLPASIRTATKPLVVRKLGLDCHLRVLTIGSCTGSTKSFSS